VAEAYKKPTGLVNVSLSEIIAAKKEFVREALRKSK
jgi:hypothetical protein